jgi:hypothetical protein
MASTIPREVPGTRQRTAAPELPTGTGPAGANQPIFTKSTTKMSVSLAAMPLPGDTDP